MDNNVECTLVGKTMASTFHGSSRAGGSSSSPPQQAASSHSFHTGSSSDKGVSQQKASAFSSSASFRATQNQQLHGLLHSDEEKVRRSYPFHGQQRGGDKAGFQRSWPALWRQDVTATPLLGQFYGDGKETPWQRLSEMVRKEILTIGLVHKLYW